MNPQPIGDIILCTERRGIQAIRQELMRRIDDLRAHGRRRRCRAPEVPVRDSERQLRAIGRLAVRQAIRLEVLGVPAALRVVRGFEEIQPEKRVREQREHDRPCVRLVVVVCQVRAAGEGSEGGVVQDRVRELLREPGVVLEAGQLACGSQGDGCDDRQLRLVRGRRPDGVDGRQLHGGV